MGMQEIIYLDAGREIAREGAGAPPCLGEEIYIEQTAGVIDGGLFLVARIRRVLVEAATGAGITRAIAGGPTEVTARAVYVHLTRQ